MGAREGYGDEEVVQLFGEHGAVGDLAGLGGAEGFLWVPEDAFHEAVDGVAAVVAGVDVEAVFADGYWVFDLGGSVGFGVDGEVVLCDQGAAFDAAALADVDLPGPVSVGGEFVFGEAQWG